MPPKAAKYPAARSAVQEARRLVIMNLERRLRTRPYRGENRGPARIVVESLTPIPGVRELNRHNSDVPALLPFLLAVSFSVVLPSPDIIPLRKLVARLVVFADSR
jgi:hypothetical protein